jgi:hypothetical protein
MTATSHHIRFILDNQLVELDFQQSKNTRPSTTLLNYLRSLP